MGYRASLFWPREALSRRPRRVPRCNRSTARNDEIMSALGPVLTNPSIQIAGTSDIRFTLRSRHYRSARACPLRASSGSRCGRFRRTRERWMFFRYCSRCITGTVKLDGTVWTLTSVSAKVNVTKAFEKVERPSRPISPAMPGRQNQRSWRNQ